MSPPTVYVSTSGSAKDAEWRDQLASHLGVLEQSGVIETWHRGLVAGGGEPYLELQAALERTEVAVALLSSDYLALPRDSLDSLLEDQERRLLERRARDGLVLVVPVLVRPCLWEQDPWLGSLQPCPPGAEALSRARPAEAEANLVEVVKEIRQAVTGKSLHPTLLDPGNRESYDLSVEHELDSAELLPYLADREPQYTAFRQAIRASLNEFPRPQVFIIHGDERECHEMLLRCLRQEKLPKLLPHGHTSESVPYLLTWPTCFKSFEELRDLLLACLAEKVLGDSYATLQAINDRLATIPGPVVVSTYVMTADWHDHGPLVVQGFLKFWQRWCELMVGQRLLVFLMLKYSETSFGSRFLRFLPQRRRAEKINEKIRGYLEDELDTEAFDPVVCRPLPRLEGVGYKDAADWARDRAGRFCRVQDLLRDVRLFYERRGAERVPMEDLAIELSGLLHKHRK